MNKEAYNYCIFLLSKRDYSRYKIKQKLKTRKYTEEEIEEVINYLVENTYLREEQYTKVRIKSLAYRGYSSSYIKRKLKEEQIFVELEFIDTILDDEHIIKEESIERLIAKKYKQEPKSFEEKMKIKNRILRFLISKGYSYNDILNHLPKALK
ncbi:MAG: recombination regulator RecX [Bacteriovoracaceae bacterium]|jgi:regulatory protein|nr:recombination regulator RecX [Bacteriovoracaceae bacterium]